MFRATHDRLVKPPLGRRKIKMEYCSICEYEKRNVWPGLVGHSSFKKEISHPENYSYSLKRCSNCGHLWCLHYYEPHSSFPYLVKWQESLERFIETKIEILHKWHAYSINYEVQRLPDSKRGPFLTNGQISGVIEKFDDFSKEPSEYLK